MKKSTLVRGAILSAIIPINASAQLYWDLNGTTDGAGATPTGTWDTTALNWNTNATGTDPTVVWATGQTAIFSAGNDATSAFTVTITGTQTAAGITLEEGNITFAGGTAAVGTGSITINTGAALRIDAAARISGSRVVLNGGSLTSTQPSNAVAFIPTATLIEVGPNGGTVAYASSGAGTVSTYAGTIVGNGVLTKTGPNEFRYQGLGLPNTTYSKLVVSQGLFRLGFNSSIADERGFGAVPTVFTPDAITLSGGGSIATSFNAPESTLHVNRGITLGAGGGVIASLLTVPGAVTGSGSLTTTASGVFLNGLNTFTGGLNVNTGTTTVGATGGLIAQSVNTVGTGALAVNGVVSGSGALTKTGTGILTLAGANTFSGGIDFGDGRINFNNSSAAGGGSITVGAGADEFTNSVPNVILANGITLSAGANPKIYSTAGNSLNITGVISGAGSLLRDDTGNGTLTFSGANTYSGGFKITSRGISIANKAGFGIGTLTIGDAVTAPANAIAINAASDLSGANSVANPVVVNRDFTTSGNNLQLTSAIDLGANTRTITANNTAGSATILSGSISGAGGALTKAGTGTLEIAGTTSYDGATTVTAGTLLVSGNLAGTSQVAVSATLGGTGVIAPASGGNVNVLVNGVLSPGASVGTLTVNLSGGGKLDLTAGVTALNSQALKFELATPASSDKISLSGGALEIGTGVLEFDDFAFTSLAGFTTGDYVLFDGTAPITGSLGTSLTGAIGAFEGQIQLANGGTDIVLHVAVPEPSAAVALIGGAAMLLGFRRRTA